MSIPRFDNAPCVNNYKLFDSKHEVDHYEARLLCKQCPYVVTTCRGLARDTLNATPTSRVYGLDGTWAGELFGIKGKNRPAWAIVKKDAAA